MFETGKIYTVLIGLEICTFLVMSIASDQTIQVKWSYGDEEFEEPAALQRLVMAYEHFSSET